MKVTSEKLENCQVKVFVELDAAEVEDKLRETARKISRQFTVPGYRRGKAPFAAVVRTFGREALQQQALEDFGNDLYDQAVEQIEYEPYQAGELQDVEWNPFRMAVLIPIQPEVELGDYRAVRVPFEVPDVADEEVAAYLERLREEHAQWVPAERPAELDDQVVLDARATAGGETLFERSNLELRLHAGGTDPLPGFHEQIVGLSAGESKAFTLPRGQEGDEQPEASVAVDLHTVRFLDRPALDDDLALMVGDYETLDDLRASVRDKLSTDARQEAEAQYLEKVLDAMVEIAPRIEYPSQAIDHEAESSLHQMERNLAASGITLDNFLRMLRKTREAYLQDLRPAAEQRLKKRLVLQEVARREGLEATDDAVEAEIARMTQLMGPQADQMRQLLESPGGRQSVADDLVIMQAQERVLQIARGEAPPLAQAEAAAAPQTEGQVLEEEAKAVVEVLDNVESPPETRTDPSSEHVAEGDQEPATGEPAGSD